MHQIQFGTVWLSSNKHQFGNDIFLTSFDAKQQMRVCMSVRKTIVIRTHALEASVFGTSKTHESSEVINSMQHSLNYLKHLSVQTNFPTKLPNIYSLLCSLGYGYPLANRSKFRQSYGQYFLFIWPIHQRCGIESGRQY